MFFTDIDLNKLTVEEVSKLKRKCEDHLETWFAFSTRGRENRTEEFIAATRWRLEGMTEPCCECGDRYPKADLHFYGEIYCAKCSKELKC